MFLYMELLHSYCSVGFFVLCFGWILLWIRVFTASWSLGYTRAVTKSQLVEHWRLLAPYVKHFPKSVFVFVFVQNNSCIWALNVHQNKLPDQFDKPKIKMSDFARFLIFFGYRSPKYYHLKAYKVKSDKCTLLWMSFR